MIRLKNRLLAFGTAVLMVAGITQTGVFAEEFNAETVQNVLFDTMRSGYNKILDYDLTSGLGEATDDEINHMNLSVDLIYEDKNLVYQSGECDIVKTDNFIKGNGIVKVNGKEELNQGVIFDIKNSDIYIDKDTTVDNTVFPIDDVDLSKIVELTGEEKREIYDKYYKIFEDGVKASSGSVKINGDDCTISYNIDKEHIWYILDNMGKTLKNDKVFEEKLNNQYKEVIEMYDSLNAETTYWSDTYSALTLDEDGLPLAIVELPECFRDLYDLSLNISVTFNKYTNDVSAFSISNVVQANELESTKVVNEFSITKQISKNKGVFDITLNGFGLDEAVHGKLIVTQDSLNKYNFTCSAEIGEEVYNDIITGTITKSKNDEHVVSCDIDLNKLFDVDCVVHIDGSFKDKNFTVKIKCDLDEKPVTIDIALVCDRVEVDEKAISSSLKDYKLFNSTDYTDAADTYK